jgi:hypothetical protein
MVEGDQQLQAAVVQHLVAEETEGGVINTLRMRKGSG